MFPRNFNPAKSSIQFDPVTLMVVGTAVAAGGQIYQGYSAQQAAKHQAGLQEEQARIALAEANRAADQKSVEQRKFLAEQRMAYLASGVSLEGTPGIVGADTFDQFQQEINAMRKSGAQEFRFGMENARATKANGRAQMIAGMLGATSTVFSGASKMGSVSSPKAPAGSVSDKGSFSTTTRGSTTFRNYTLT